MKGITLIGMPGAGKSTIGRKLAGRLNFRFIDLDDLIKEKEGKTHTVILEERGAGALCDLENTLTLSLSLDGMVFSPGGSIIYSSASIEKVRAETLVVNLELPLHILKGRLAHSWETRGIVGLKEKGLEGVYAERVPLYRAAAHHTIICDGKTEQEIINAILQHQS